MASTKSRGALRPSDFGHRTSFRFRPSDFGLRTSCALLLIVLSIFTASSQVTNPMPGRVLAKLLPDYLRPRMYALNQGNGSSRGTLLALNPTNGAILNEITVNTNPTDMVVTPASDALYVINAGSRTISKVDLATFTVVAEDAISTPYTYSLSNPLYVVAAQSGILYYTDGAWGPEVYLLDYSAGTNSLVLNTGGNQSSGAGGMVLNRSGTALFIWQQYGWSAGYAGSAIASMTVGTNSLTTTATGPSQSRDPLDTPILLDAAETKVFNKVQMVSATNVSVLLTQFAENIYAISFDGSLAFGPTKVFNTLNGIALTNFNYSATVEALSGDQKKLFRYLASSSSLLVHDMGAVAPVNGPTVVPTPADGAVVGLPPTNLTWTVSPIALAYDVYFGTNQAQVTAATPSSPLYLGRVTSPGEPVPGTLSAGATYYWRVDVAGFSTTNIGPTWSFTVSQLAIAPSQLNIGAIAGYNPASTTLSLTSSVLISWTATVAGSNWLAVGPANGTSPSTLTVNFNTAALPAGTYTNRIDIRVGNLTTQVPVTLSVNALNIVKMATDYQRPYIYALQAPPASGQNGQLLFINTATSNIDKTLPIGFNPVDLTVHNGEGRLYIASWTENATYVVDLTTQKLLPPLQLGTDVYKINAGIPGQIVIEGEDQWVYMSLIDTTNGSTITQGFVREGDGDFDPTGRYYYHSDNNISGAGITKFDVSTNTFSAVAGSGGNYYYGSRNVVLSPDGTRVFWTGEAYDANLNELGNLGEEIYATTAHGDLAFGSQHVFNVNNGQNIYTLPFSTSILAVSGDQQKIFLYNSSTARLSVIPMSAIASVPGPGLNPTPPDGSVVNPPLAQVSWTTSPFALSYRVFMGTNQTAVLNATTNSPLYLGPTSSTTFALSNSLNWQTTYYWRVDSVGFSSMATGAVWSFTVSAVGVSPQTISVKAVTGLPILPQSLSLSAGSPTHWTLGIASNWLAASASSGTTPSTTTLSFNTTNLAAGFYTNQLTFAANGINLQFPVVVQLINLSASKIAVDPNRNYIYVLHPGSGSFNDAFLLFLNTDTGVVEKVLPVGNNPTDLTVNRFEDKLYVSNWQHNQTRVVDLVSETELLPPLALGTDVYKLNAGRAGRLIIEGEDQWIAVSIIDTVAGTNVGSFPYPEREGDGETDPTGNYYYHCDNNISDANIHKFVMTNDTPVEIAGSAQHPYGTRNLLLSPDGGRLFWNSYVFDANLNQLLGLGGEIYGCSTNGSVAFTASQAYDTTTGSAIFTLPVSSSVMAVDRMDQRLWYFNGTTARMESISMRTIRSPSISGQPAGLSVVLGNSANFTVTATGLSPYSYQWMTGGTNLPGATNLSLSLTNVQPAQAGDYQVLVSNQYGAVTSTVAHLTVLIPPAITAQPQSTNVLAGRAFTLSVQATGTAPLTYSWSFEGVAISGATGTNLTITSAQSVNEGLYRVTVANSAGSLASVGAEVRVLPAAPTIVSNPLSVTVYASSNATFSSLAIGSLPLTYQWLFNGSPVSGAIGNPYTLTNAQLGLAGNYQAWVTNGAGSATSAVATLTVLPLKPYFVLQPTGAALLPGTNFTLSALARGSEPISYQWRQNTGAITGAVQTTLTLSNTTFSASGAYDVIASNIAGLSTSLVASVVVTASPPSFTQQPVATSALVGATVTLTSLATGTSPIFYQWYFNGGALANQTNRQLTLTNVALSSTGPYFDIASNAYGRATSSVAQVTVSQPPLLLLGLTNQIVDAGSSVFLAVAATGTGPLSYSWQFNGSSIPGTNASLLLTNVQTPQVGYYAALISSPYGSVSSTGRVTIFGLPSSVVAWGDNSGGQTNVPANLNDVVAVSGGDYHTLALRRDGSLVAWGYNGDGQATVPGNGARFVAIASGAGHNLAITPTGSVFAWGRNDALQTNVPAAAVAVLAVAAGDSHSLALLSSGAVLAWGDNTYGQGTVPGNVANIRAIAAGRNHNLALQNSGTVIGWGFNSYGQAAPPAGLVGVAAITAGYLHSVALLSNGTVAVWGDNTFGQTNAPAGLSNVVAIAAGDFHTLAMRADGSVVGWGDDSFRQIEVPARVTYADALASGYYHGLALLPTALLQYQMNAAGLLVQWKGPFVLQWAPSPAGPFSDIPGAAQGYTNYGWSSPAKFFRLRR